MTDHVPTIEVPAQVVLDKFNATNTLSCKLEGVVGILTIISDRLSGKAPESSALQVAVEQAEECLKMADSLQWTYADEAAAAKALQG